MKSAAIIGVILIVLGVAILAYQGITYTTKQTIVDVGPIHAEAEHQHTIPLPPIIGVTAMVGGIVLLVSGARQRT
jgi:drug/metabolite transporter (DMT)-like permease